MKTVLEEIQFRLDSASNVDASCCNDVMVRPSFTEVTFSIPRGINPEKLKVLMEVEVPETISEFKEKHGIKGKKLTEWLNENYD